MGNVANYVAPFSPGFLAKGLFLKIDKGLNLTEYTSAVASNAFLLLSVTSLSGAVIVLINPFMDKFWYLFSSSFIVFALSTLFFLKGSEILKFLSISYFHNIAKKASTGLDLISADSRNLVFVIITLLLQIIVSSLLMFQLFWSIGQPIEMNAALLIAIFTILSNFFSVTPGNIGIQEVVMGFLSTLYGSDFGHGLLVGSVLRAAHIFITFTIGSFFIFSILKNANLEFKNLID